MRHTVFIFGLFLFIQCRSHLPGNQTSLENTYWKLVEVNGTPVKTPENGREVYMMLTTEGDAPGLQGHAGCNGLGGSYQVDGDKIKFQPITTRMFCEKQMEVENLFTRMLTTADRYRVTGNKLALYTGQDLLGIFESVYKNDQ